MILTKLSNFPKRVDKDFFFGIISGNMPRHVGVWRSVQFMIRNYCRPIQLRDVVRISGMSRRGLLQAFDRHMGLKPMQIVRRARIERAKRLLLEKDLLLKEIAGRCGYRSENTFCVSFQRAVGMPPKKFQRHFLLKIRKIYTCAHNQSL